MHSSHVKRSSVGDAAFGWAWSELPLKLERCEERLVLSALPLFDVTHHLIDHPVSGSNLTQLPNLEDLSGNTTLPSLMAQASAAHAQTGWNEVQRLFGIRGEDQTVAVIDSGIAWDHIALGRGFGSGYRVVGGWDFAENDPLPYDDAPAGFHGTHVSGIIGADNATRPGVAPGVDLVALRVFDDNGKGQLAWTESALRWVHQHRNAFASPITTVNLSLGSSWNSASVPSWGTLEDELLQLQQDGIVVVASAGNSFKQFNAPGLSYPAASPFVIPVASVDANGQMSDYSQRHDRVIAAPGRQINSTVPDHVLGIDGRVDDWSVASGTSMAAPYVAGAAVLIRQAMEMAGRDSISPQEIYQWMSDTADSIWDNTTQAAYDRLNLSRAISSLVPQDNVGDDWNQASSIEMQSRFTVDGWLNTLSDRDAYRFTAERDGIVQVAYQSEWLDDIRWSAWANGQAIELVNASDVRLQVQAGQSCALALSDADQIGSFTLDWTFTPIDANGNESGSEEPSKSAATDLGSVDYREIATSSGRDFTWQAAHDGTLSVLVQAADGASQALEVRDERGQIFRDATVENGMWRIDVDAAEDSRWFVHIPGRVGNESRLIVANVIQRTGSMLEVFGTSGSDSLSLTVEPTLRLDYERVPYSFAQGSIATIELDLGSGSDKLHLQGGKSAEKVELRPERTLYETQQLAIDVQATEEITFVGGGGPDRVYLYGSTGDDTLTARPRDVELAGPGFRFHLEQIERTYVHAEQGGQDFAYFYDSVGDDRLSVRPQFSSLSGKDFFNYASGIERVYAYSKNGGYDTATLYDSIADDTYFTSGDVASMVGAGFFSYTRYFESVEAISSAGGKDVASIYAADRSSLLAGSDLAGYQDAEWSRFARGFVSAKTYVDNQLIGTQTFQQAISWQVDTAWPSLASHQPLPLEGFGEATSDLIEVRGAKPTDSVTFPQNFLRLSEVEEQSIELGWLDRDHESRMLDAIFAEHGLESSPSSTSPVPG